MPDLLDTVAFEIARNTDLDRVMIYRFHADLHGEVVAEKVKEGVDSYAGLHYPASDIPAPARAVFLKNWVRMIPDVNYRPVPLILFLNPLTQSPTDLGTSLLRAVSPVHIEYSMNMGVAFSLTVSLIVDGKLWGLIACHHLKKLYLGMDIRDACEAIGRMASAFIAIRIESDEKQAKSRYRQVHQQLLEHLHSGIDMAAELTRQAPNLPDLILSGGSAAALYLEGYWAVVGDTPSVAQLDALAGWLAAEHPGKILFTSDSIANVYAGAVNFHPDWCGVMAVAIPKTEKHYIIWFRPEAKTTVTWAGKSMPWTVLEQQAALELRFAVMSVDLQKQYLKEQEARIEVERATKAREELMLVLSHDLKNPLGSIRLGAQFATKFLDVHSFQKVGSYLDRIEKTTASMDMLISDILSITKLEAGHGAKEMEFVSIRTLLMEIIDLVLPIASDKKIELLSELGDEHGGTMCDRGQIFQVISSILGNAIKFTPEFGKITVTFSTNDPKFARIKIADNGPGIDPVNLNNIFDRFWQAKHTRRFGTGIGLAIVRGITESHGGRVWAESDGKSGTIFQVMLPMLKFQNPVP